MYVYILKQSTMILYSGIEYHRTQYRIVYLCMIKNIKNRSKNAYMYIYIYIMLFVYIKFIIHNTYLLFVWRRASLFNAYESLPNP